jgi:hypothetical protein
MKNRQRYQLRPGWDDSRAEQIFDRMQGQAAILVQGNGLVSFPGCSRADHPYTLLAAFGGKQRCAAGLIG